MLHLDDERVVDVMERSGDREIRLPRRGSDRGGVRHRGHDADDDHARAASAEDQDVEGVSSWAALLFLGGVIGVFVVAATIVATGSVTRDGALPADWWGNIGMALGVLASAGLFEVMRGRATGTRDRSSPGSRSRRLSSSGGARSGAVEGVVVDNDGGEASRGDRRSCPGVRSRRQFLNTTTATFLLDDGRQALEDLFGRLGGCFTSPLVSG